MDFVSNRKIESLYFENNKREMYSDSVEGLTPRKKIRVRNYPGTKDENLYLEIKISSVEGRFKTRKILDKNKFDEDPPTNEIKFKYLFFV